MKPLLQIFVLYMCCTVSFPNASAQNIAPFDLQALLLFKFLKYDNNENNYKDKMITFAIIIDSRSKPQLQAIQKGFGHLNGKKLHNKTAKVVYIFVDKPENLEKMIVKSQAHFLYFPGSTIDSTLKVALALARQKRFPTLGGSEELVIKGVCVGLKIEKQMPKIIVNLKEAQKQGLKPSSQVLQLAKVIR